MIFKQKSLTNFLVVIVAACLLFLAYGFSLAHAPPRLTIAPDGTEHLKGPGMDITYHKNGSSSNLTMERLTVASINAIKERAEFHPKDPNELFGNIYGVAMWNIDQEAQQYGSYEDMVRDRLKHFYFF